MLRAYQFTQGIIVQQLEKKSWKEITKEKLNFDVDACPCCKTGKMIRVMSFDANAPPVFIKLLEHQNNPDSYREKKQ